MSEAHDERREPERIEPERIEPEQREPEQREPEGWDGWASAHRRKLTLGLRASPAERLAWLEEAIAFAYRAGALPRRPSTRMGQRW